MGWSLEEQYCVGTSYSFLYIASSESDFVVGEKLNDIRNHVSDHLG